MGDPPGHQEPARVLERRRVVRPAGLSRSFLILHGLEGSGPGHWQTWLAERLRERGEDVRYPDLPDPLEPQPQDWLALLREELAAMEGERVVLCHSLGCLLWMLFAAECPRVAADRVLLVAPPCDWSIPAIGRFRPNRTDQKTLDAAARETLVLWADPDPYCPGGALRAFAGAFSNAVEIDGGGHLNTDAGYGAWPAIERWALSGDFA